MKNYLTVPLLLWTLSIYAQQNISTRAERGVRYYDSTQTQQGINLIDNEFLCLFMDLEGNILKNYPVGLATFFRDGTIIGKADTFLVKLDQDLNIIWKAPTPIHHECKVNDDGSIYILSEDIHDFLDQKIRFDVIKIYSSNGVLIYKWCAFDHLEELVSIISKSKFNKELRSQYDPKKGVESFVSQNQSIFQSYTTLNLEFTHFNSIQILPKNNISDTLPAFKKGNLLLSFNPYPCYGILDTSTDKIEWVGYLPDRAWLHTPKLTQSGTILIFANKTNYTKHSRIVEFNPISNKLVWEYTGLPNDSMMSGILGAAERLPNGNTLVTDVTNGGRCFEITPDKKIVWDYYLPYRDPETGLPLAFYRTYRLNPDSVKIFLNGFKQ